MLGSNSVYLQLTLALSGLYFVVTGIQYWLPSYMHNVLGGKEDLVAWYFAALSFTGPVSGVIVGGIVTQAYGGYNTKKGQMIQIYAGMASLIAGMPSPFVSDLHVFAIFIWFMLFFGGWILPQVTGIMLNSVEEHQKAQANSLATLSYNLLGCLPAPTFYGLLSQFTGDSSRVPMACLIYSCTISIGLLWYGIT